MPFIDFVAGCWGGAFGVLVGHPLDTIKVRLQTTHNERVKLSELYNRNQKVRGLFNGMSSPLACLAFVNAIVFGSYGSINEALKKKNGFSESESTMIKMRREFVAGSVSGIAQCLVSCPMELVKCRMQVYSSTTGNSITVLETIRRIQKQERGLLRGVYRGLGATLLRDAPAFGIYFSSFQFLIDTFNVTSGNPQSQGSLLMAGGLAGTLSWLLIYPADVIKTRIQIDGSKYDYSLRKCCQAMLRESNGHYRIFFKGFTPTLLRAFPVNAITFFVVRKTFDVYENHFSSDLPNDSKQSS
ncbi:mitochondrial basic amino acids transporter-like isoform X2 [Brevipalpus obovatus]|uniref:mitochondrial basic amino acids transporter-like isoform X2 n=1 Tax=Brevipalpus obovatus TaxID=246614 RepID=UPI003D9E292B